MKTMQLGNAEFEIVEPVGVQPVSVDVITEWRVFNGTVCVSLGSLVTDAQNAPQIAIVSRLRMSPQTAANLHAMLGGLLNPPPEAQNVVKH